MTKLLQGLRRWLSCNYRHQGMGHVDMDGKYFQTYYLLNRKSLILQDDRRKSRRQ